MESEWNARNTYAIGTEFVWNRYEDGIGMEYVRNSHGIRFGCVWNIYVIRIEYVRNTYGICMGYVWGIHMEYARKSYGI